ncbi:hypothetical protein PROVRUST_08538, partial [Providencia rustigianii DSM 4541]
EASEQVSAITQVVIVDAAKQIKLNTPTVICSDNLTCATLNVTKGGEMTGDITHKGGKFSSNGVVVDDHSHGGVQRGGSRTEGTQ